MNASVISLTGSPPLQGNGRALCPVSVLKCTEFRWYRETAFRPKEGGRLFFQKNHEEKTSFKEADIEDETQWSGDSDRMPD